MPSSWFFFLILFSFFVFCLSVILVSVFLVFCKNNGKSLFAKVRIVILRCAQVFWKGKRLVPLNLCLPALRYSFLSIWKCITRKQHYCAGSHLSRAHSTPGSSTGLFSTCRNTSSHRDQFLYIYAEKDVHNGTAAMEFNTPPSKKHQSKQNSVNRGLISAVGGRPP